MTKTGLQQLLGRLWHGADYNYEQWLDRPDILDEDFRLMGLAQCSLMSVGIFSWSMLEPEEGQYHFDWLDNLMDRLAAAGVMAALATPSAAPPAWLAQKYEETRRMAIPGQRHPHRGRQNFCYSSPGYRQKVIALNRLLAERYKTHPALALWHVSNEYSGLPCHCELCYAAFHEWLQAHYGSLDALNHAWWTAFWSHRYTRWEQITPVDDSMQGMMLDWQRFTSDRALDFFIAEAAPLREITPHIPVTTNFMQPDVGLNYWRFARHVDIVSWDSYPRWHQGDDLLTAAETAFYHDLHRSYKGGQPFLLIESTPGVTNWQGVSRLKKPGVHHLTSLQAVAHGSNSVMYFQWRQSRGGEEQFHSAVVSHLGHEHTRTFREVQEVGAWLAALDGLADSRASAEAAVIYDFENEWALQHAKLPRSVDKNYQQACISHYRQLWQAGVAADVVHMEADFSSYQLVIAPMLYMLRDGVAKRLEAFVQGGGVLVMTYLSGMVDVSGLCFMGGWPPALRRTLGLWCEELDTLTDSQAGSIVPCSDGAGLRGSYSFYHYAELLHSETAEVLAVYDSDFYRGRPALTLNRAGAGRSYYMAARTDETLLADFYTMLLAELPLKRAPVALPQGVVAQVRETAAERFLFLMNFAAEARDLEIGDGFMDAASRQRVGPRLHLPAYGISILRQPL